MKKTTHFNIVTDQLFGSDWRSKRPKPRSEIIGAFVSEFEKLIISNNELRAKIKLMEDFLKNVSCGQRSEVREEYVTRIREEAKKILEMRHK